MIIQSIPLKCQNVLVAMCFLQVALGMNLWGNLKCKGQYGYHELTETLIDESKTGPSITHILRSQDYTLTPNEMESVKKHMFSIQQLGYSRMREAETSEIDKNKLMQEDFGSLKKSLREFFNLPQTFTDFFKDDNSDYDLCYGKWRRLEEIVDRIEQLHPASVGKDSIPNNQGEDKILIGLLREMMATVAQMSPNLSSQSLHSRFIHLQKILFETIYYFFKHQLISLEQFRNLFKSYNTIILLSKHIFKSYKYQQHLISSPILPQSSKNALENWYYSSFKGLLEGLEEGYRKIFSYEYNRLSVENYMNLPKEEKNQGQLNEKLSQIAEITFNIDKKAKDKVSGYFDEGTQWNNVKKNNYIELIDTFTNIHRFDNEGKTDLELTLLHHIIEYWKELYPKETQEAEEGNYDFKKKINLMSSSSQLISELENIHIYLNKEFKKSSWNIFSFRKKDKSPENFELKMIANYIKIIEQERYHSKENTDYKDPLMYRYFQYGTIYNRIELLKSKLIKLVQ